MIETHVTNKREYERRRLGRQYKIITYTNYRDLDDDLNKVIKDVRREYERRQKERYDIALKTEKMKTNR